MASGAQQYYADLVAHFAREPDVTPPSAPSNGKKTFGSATLRVNGRIFAMLVDDDLVLKLPRARVAALLAAGEAGPFDGGKGKPMQEWLRLPPTRQDQWLPLAEEALAFVRGT
jgi:hypothetical protein